MAVPSRAQSSKEESLFSLAFAADMFAQNSGDFGDALPVLVYAMTRVSCELRPYSRDGEGYRGVS
jgi:hypothetical protein